MVRPIEIVHYQARTNGAIACGVPWSQDVSVSPFHQAVTCPDCLVTPLIHDWRDNAHRSVCRNCRAVYLVQS